MPAATAAIVEEATMVALVAATVSSTVSAASISHSFVANDGVVIQLEAADVRLTHRFPLAVFARRGLARRLISVTSARVEHRFESHAIGVGLRLGGGERRHGTVRQIPAPDE